ncbi:amidase domain-containing protein [Caldisalinibacter kiritimatiensis]|uniref:Putative amidase domain-containing protein n=1 Tax=Caldisalinibacter kiritimatiensis TaxID=1304284 RepID=R1AWN3_9FIRM|nr:amidase domain-containing protein [Caldisalinibacter kiritimatiensis]EOD01032.1 hypothetical protein L21TH_0934 [Caldisalinibacter kiritimatiensis]
MIVIISRKKILVTLIIIAILVGILFSYSIRTDSVNPTLFEEQNLSDLINRIFVTRYESIVNQDKELLSSLYNKAVKYGLWAFEHETKRMIYLHKWADKQGVKFISIKPIPIIRYVKERGEGFRVNLMVSTEYKYVYENEPKVENMFRIGTYHSLDIEKNDDKWLITREWYTDPFADSLNTDNIKKEEIKKYILSRKSKEYTNLSERRIKAIEYADKYCGAAGTEETGYKYNDKYINYNPRGGDCANFASQILHEGGGFSKNYTWNYKGGGSRAWVNAQAFKNYMLYSGRASKLAYGTYEQVYKASYKLKSGDFIAYEKKGKVTHISVVTGVDSKGYVLVNCHNTDRYRVPWDLGWSNKGIKFWLVHVHY